MGLILNSTTTLYDSVFFGISETGKLTTLARRPKKAVLRNGTKPKEDGGVID